MPSKPTDEEREDAAVPEEAPAAGGDEAVPEPSPEIQEKVVEVLKTCFDPEIPVNIYELGLIYEILAGVDGRVQVKMTLTSPMCPVAGSLPGEVEQKIRAVPEVEDVKVELVWDPPWDPSKMTEAARLQLNMF